MEAPSPPESGSPTLHSQLREVYGRAAYTQKTHEKMADILVRKYRAIKFFEVVLSALASGTFLLSLLGDSRAGSVIGAALSTILLGLLLYFKEATLGELAQRHAETATKLWGVRERLLSLLVDMQDGLPEDSVRRQRDSLNQDLEGIYRVAPRTSQSAYRAAQEAFKDSEELYFSDKELDKLLPKALKREPPALPHSSP